MALPLHAPARRLLVANDSLGFIWITHYFSSRWAGAFSEAPSGRQRTSTSTVNILRAGDIPNGGCFEISRDERGSAEGVIRLVAAQPGKKVEPTLKLHKAAHLSNQGGPEPPAQI